jgi:hypothetical protein
MNGSMAFYDETFNTKVIQSGLLKSVFIMGGVLDNESATTLSTTPFLNRFASATMNQLYAKEKTGKFFKAILQKNIENKRSYKDTIKVYVISNNEINKNFTFEEFNDFKKKMHNFHLLSGVTTNELFKDFYKAKKPKYLDIYLDQNKNESDNLVPTPYKPFDVLSAFTLVQKYCNSSYQNNNQNLIYIPKFGSTIIGTHEKYINEALDIKLKNLNFKNAPNFAKKGIENEQKELRKVNINEIIQIPIINFTYRNKKDIETNIIMRNNVTCGSSWKIYLLNCLNCRWF